MHHKIFENEEIKNIYTALGVSLGTEEDERALNMTKLRYHKVVIMCDADVDGSHIETLILTFFFRHMKESIENGYVYIATPPLYLVKKDPQVYAGTTTNAIASSSSSRALRQRCRHRRAALQGSCRNERGATLGYHVEPREPHVTSSHH